MGVDTGCAGVTVVAIVGSIARVVAGEVVIDNWGCRVGLGKCTCIDGVCTGGGLELAGGCFCLLRT